MLCSIQPRSARRQAVVLLADVMGFALFSTASHAGSSSGTPRLRVVLSVLSRACFRCTFASSLPFPASCIVRCRIFRVRVRVWVWVCGVLAYLAVLTPLLRVRVFVFRFSTVRGFLYDSGFNLIAINNSEGTAVQQEHPLILSIRIQKLQCCTCKGKHAVRPTNRLC